MVALVGGRVITMRGDEVLEPGIVLIRNRIVGGGRGGFGDRSGWGLRDRLRGPDPFAGVY